MKYLECAEPLRRAGLSVAVEILVIQYRRVTNGRTNRRTHDDSKYRVSVIEITTN